MPVHHSLKRVSDSADFPVFYSPAGITITPLVSPFPLSFFFHIKLIVKNTSLFFHSNPSFVLRGEREKAHAIVEANFFFGRQESEKAGRPPQSMNANKSLKARRERLLHSHRIVAASSLFNLRHNIYRLRILFSWISGELFRKNWSADVVDALILSLDLAEVGSYIEG